MKYEIGQYVMYRHNGVFRVEAIGQLHFLQDHAQKYYTLKPSFTVDDGRSYLPITAENCLRAVITPDEAYTYLNKLSNMQVKLLRPKKWQELVSHYQALLSSDDLSERLRLLKEIHLKEKAAKEKGKQLTVTEEQYKRKIEKVLSEEFAIALNESPTRSKERLYSVLNS